MLDRRADAVPRVAPVRGCVRPRACRAVQVVCAMVVLACAAGMVATSTGWVYWKWWGEPVSARRDVYLSKGGAHVRWDRWPPPSPGDSGSFLRLWVPESGWWFRAKLNRNDGYVTVPMWAIAAPFVWLGVIARRRQSAVVPGACTRCGYDRTGLTGRACPECGRG